MRRRALVLAITFGLGVGAGASGYRLLSSAPSAVPPDLPPDLAGRLRVFILAGQSNMLGTGPIDPEDRRPLPGVFAFGPTYTWLAARDPLPGSDGVGPGLAFARELLHENPTPVGLIQCARGGTSILDWGRSRDPRSLYGFCLMRARAASVAGNLAGLLWFQGESDVEDPHRDPSPQAPHDWPQRFAQLVEAFRTDLAAPDLPVIFAQLGAVQPAANPIVARNWLAFQAQQAAIRLPGVVMIHTSDLELRDDLHFTTASYHEIGRRFAAAYLAQ